MSEPRGDLWLRRLFLALALLYIVPFWTVQYLPTIDGPCHTYNAWILRQYDNVERFPLFQEHYEINAKPYPNWSGHAVMALLMYVVPPLISEKILVTLYMLLFLGGVWYLAGAARPDQRWLAFLGFPFAYQQLFQFGFYNFSLSLALFPWIVGYWWKRRASPSLGFAVGINLLLWACWFSHILSFALALIAISVLWLVTLRRDNWRRHLLHIPILVPQVALPLWFFSIQGAGVADGPWGTRRLVEYFLRLEVLQTFTPSQIWFGMALVAIFIALMILTVSRETFRTRRLREGDAFLLLAIVFTAIYFFSPEGMSGGSLLRQRLSLYPYLLLIPWLSPRLGPRAERVGLAVLALVALGDLAYLNQWYQRMDVEMARYQRGLEAVPPNTRLIALNFRDGNLSPIMHVHSHAVGYAAIEKGLIDWDNYEAKTSFFPVKFRSSVVQPTFPLIALVPGEFKPRMNRGLIDIVYIWGMPSGHALDQRMRRFYQLVSDKDGGAVYAIKRRRRENVVSRMPADSRADAASGSQRAAVSSSQP